MGNLQGSNAALFGVASVGTTATLSLMVPPFRTCAFSSDIERRSCIEDVEDQSEATCGPEKLAGVSCLERGVGCLEPLGSGFRPTMTTLNQI